MRFPRFLAAGVVVSLALHGNGSAFFAKDPDEVSIAASAGGGVSVIGTSEDLVAGLKVNKAALDMVRRASPMPNFPSDMRLARLNIEVPMRFTPN
ncbi:hypothetical protein [uncultured Roseibium sp.]|uniref:hypothetical protein n=1 Tax=uncultured Roseibium sp. TaxID=1936171 RepID=UPI002629B806|nr:hypothetical protein [uncultured Roseibium sp.]